MNKLRIKCPLCGFVTPADRVLLGDAFESWIGLPIAVGGRPPRGVSGKGQGMGIQWKKRELDTQERRALINKLRDIANGLEEAKTL